MRSRHIIGPACHSALREVHFGVRYQVRLAARRPLADRPDAIRSSLDAVISAGSLCGCALPFAKLSDLAARGINAGQSAFNSRVGLANQEQRRLAAAGAGLIAFREEGCCWLTGLGAGPSLRGTESLAEGRR